MFFLNPKWKYPVALSALLGAALPAGAQEFTRDINVYKSGEAPCGMSVTSPAQGTTFKVEFDKDKEIHTLKTGLSVIGETSPRYLVVRATGGTSSKTCSLSAVHLKTEVKSGSEVPEESDTGKAMAVSVGSKGGRWMFAPIIADIRSEQHLPGGTQIEDDLAAFAYIKDKVYVYPGASTLSSVGYGNGAVAGLKAARNPFYITKQVSSSGPNIAPLAKDGSFGELDVKPGRDYVFKSVDIGIGLVLAAQPMNSGGVADITVVGNEDKVSMYFTVTVTQA